MFTAQREAACYFPSARLTAVATTTAIAILATSTTTNGATAVMNASAGPMPETAMSCAHLAVLDTDQIPVKAGDDASDARWFTVFLTRREEIRPGLLHYELRLEGGGQVLSSSLECPLLFDEDSCLAKNSRGLAFDHGTIILCGLKELFHI